MLRPKFNPETERMWTFSEWDWPTKLMLRTVFKSRTDSKTPLMLIALFGNTTINYACRSGFNLQVLLYHYSRIFYLRLGNPGFVLQRYLHYVTFLLLAIIIAHKTPFPCCAILTFKSCYLCALFTATCLVKTCFLLSSNCEKHWKWAIEFHQQKNTSASPKQNISILLKFRSFVKKFQDQQDSFRLNLTSECVRQRQRAQLWLEFICAPRIPKYHRTSTNPRRKIVNGNDDINKIC